MIRSVSRRQGFSLVEVIVALTLLTGVLLGFASFAVRLAHTNRDIANISLASDLAVARLEQVKGNRVYATLVTTFNNQTETWASSSPNVGFTRQTFATRTNNVNNDYTTVTVIVSGRNLTPAIRRTTSIAAY